MLFTICHKYLLCFETYLVKFYAYQCKIVRILLIPLFYLSYLFTGYLLWRKLRILWIWYNFNSYWSRILSTWMESSWIWIKHCKYKMCILRGCFSNSCMASSVAKSHVNLWKKLIRWLTHYLIQWSKYASHHPTVDFWCQHSVFQKRVSFNVKYV